MMHASMLRRAVPVAFAALVSAACEPAKTTAVSAAGQEVVVTVSPTTATVAPQAQRAFVASVTGTADTAVTWSLQEGATGGAVSAAGVYTAPAGQGTFHLVATSVADPTRSALAVITVPAPPPVVVTVSPRTPTVAASGQVTFSATVTGATSGAVTWSVQEPSGCGAVTAGGVYTAPPAAATCHVVATSVAAPSSSDVATVTVTAPPPPVSVSITPTAPSVNGCKTLSFTATVTGSADTAVAWSVTEGAAGGTITTAGAYTAPSTAGTYHVVATSHADGTKTATATVTVTDLIISVAVSPATVTVAPGGTAQFTATVTTSCGTFSATQLVMAPAGAEAPN